MVEMLAAGGGGGGGGGDGCRHDRGRRVEGGAPGEVVAIGRRSQVRRLIAGRLQWMVGVVGGVVVVGVGVVIQRGVGPDVVGAALAIGGQT